MGFHADFESDAVPDLFSEFGESVTRITENETATAVTAIVELQGEEFDEITKTWDQRGSVWVLDSVTVDRSDKWSVRGRVYKTERWYQAESGMRRIDIIAQRKTGARP